MLGRLHIALHKAILGISPAECGALFRSNFGVVQIGPGRFGERELAGDRGRIYQETAQIFVRRDLGKQLVLVQAVRNAQGVIQLGGMFELQGRGKKAVLFLGHAVDFRGQRVYFLGVVFIAEVSVLDVVTHSAGSSAHFGDMDGRAFPHAFRQAGDCLPDLIGCSGKAKFKAVFSAIQLQDRHVIPPIHGPCSC